MNKEITLNSIKLISERRKALGLSYQKLADLTGLSKSTVQRYETGAIKNLPVEKLPLLAKALNTSPSYLMGWPEIDYSFPPDLSHDLIEEEFAKLLIKAEPFLTHCGFKTAKLDNNKLQELSTELINHLKLLSFKYNKE